jgi:hypothetical protein
VSVLLAELGAHIPGLALKPGLAHIEGALALIERSGTRIKRNLHLFGLGSYRSKFLLGSGSLPIELGDLTQPRRFGLVSSYQFVGLGKLGHQISERNRRSDRIHRYPPIVSVIDLVVVINHVKSYAAADCSRFSRSLIWFNEIAA